MQEYAIQLAVQSCRNTVLHFQKGPGIETRYSHRAPGSRMYNAAGLFSSPHPTSTEVGLHLSFHVFKNSPDNRDRRPEEQGRIKSNYGWRLRTLPLTLNALSLRRI